MTTHAKPANEPSFDQALLGMEGFDAARAERYRAEISALISHQYIGTDRIGAGAAGVLFLGLLPLGAFAVLNGGMFASYEIAKYIFALTLTLTGLLLGGWLLCTAATGGYRRRAGDLFGVLVATLFCSGGAGTSLAVAHIATQSITRVEAIFVAGVFVALLLGYMLAALIQRTYWHTQEKLLAIEYRIAESQSSR